jgi:hypothetical protein
VFCGCEITELVYVVFCDVTDVHKFDFRLVKTKPLIYGDQYLLNKLGHAVPENHVFDRICMSVVDHRRECYGALLTLYRSTAFSGVRRSNFSPSHALMAPIGTTAHLPSRFQVRK